jgi:hypothetical protein
MDADFLDYFSSSFFVCHTKKEGKKSHRCIKITKN